MIAKIPPEIIPMSTLKIPALPVIFLLKIIMTSIVASIIRAQEITQVLILWIY